MIRVEACDYNKNKAIWRSYSFLVILLRQSLVNNIFTRLPTAYIRKEHLRKHIIGDTFKSLINLSLLIHFLVAVSIFQFFILGYTTKIEDIVTSANAKTNKVNTRFFIEEQLLQPCDYMMQLIKNI